jgi:hypothetical protein
MAVSVHTPFSYCHVSAGMPVSFPRPSLFDHWLSKKVVECLYPSSFANIISRLDIQLTLRLKIGRKPSHDMLEGYGFIRKVTSPGVFLKAVGCWRIPSTSSWPKGTREVVSTSGWGNVQNRFVSTSYTELTLRGIKAWIIFIVRGRSMAKVFPMDHDWWRSASFLISIYWDSYFVWKIAKGVNFVWLLRTKKTSPISCHKAFTVFALSRSESIK